MLTSVFEARRGVLGGFIYPELARKRVLITGLSASAGVDVARAFADHGCRMVLQIRSPSQETDALLAVLADSAEEIEASHAGIEAPEEAVRFTQSAVSRFGGLDIVVNLIPLDRDDLDRSASVADVEDLIACRLQGALQATRVAANRMGLTWSHGIIINVLAAHVPLDGGEAAMIAVARSVLAGMTRQEAQYWARDGVRINAIAPPTILSGGYSASDGEVASGIAALTLYLAAGRGADMSGLMLDPTIDLSRD